MPSKLTDNAYSILQNPYLRPPHGYLLATRSVNSFGLSVTSFNGENIVAVLQQDLSFSVFKQEPDGKWVSDVITSSSPTATGTKTQCYSVDIASVDDNGFPTPGVKSTFGTSIATIININGSDVFLQPGQEVDITFNLAGRCGLTVETWESIIPNTYS